jgi:hypothetical protein
MQAFAAAETKLKKVFLANSVDLISEEYMEVYKALGVTGVGMNKDRIVVKKPDGHIVYKRPELIERVGDNESTLGV